MLNNISWQGYWICLAITLVFYYAVVLLFYYNQSLLSWLRSRNRLSSPSTGGTPLKEGKLFFTTDAAEAAREEMPEALPGVTSLVDEVQAYFEAVASAAPPKTQLLQDLRNLAHKYPMVKGSTYQYSVNNLILFLSEQTGTGHLSAEEVASVWLG